MRENTSETNTKPAPLSWGEQNRLGRQLAADALAQCSAESNPTLLMREFEARVAHADRGVLVGFFHEIAERQIRFG